MNTRKTKLVALQQHLDLETGEFLTRNPIGSLLFKKTARKQRLDKQIMDCRLCKGLNIKSSTRAVPAWGNLNANIFFVGESPCVHSMVVQVPFAHKSGRILDIILSLSGLTRYDVCISDSIHCHTIRDRNPEPEEMNNCTMFLNRILHIVKPKLIIPLGAFAKIAIEKIDTKSLKCKVMPATHPARFLYNPRGIKDYILKLSLELDKYK